MRKVAKLIMTLGLLLSMLIPTSVSYAETVNAIVQYSLYDLYTGEHVANVNFLSHATKDASLIQSTQWFNAQGIMMDPAKYNITAVNSTLAPFETTAGTVEAYSMNVVAYTTEQALVKQIAPTSSSADILPVIELAPLEASDPVVAAPRAVAVRFVEKATQKTLLSETTTTTETEELNQFIKATLAQELGDYRLDDVQHVEAENTYLVHVTASPKIATPTKPSSEVSSSTQNVQAKAEQASSASVVQQSSQSTSASTTKQTSVPKAASADETKAQSVKPQASSTNEVKNKPATPAASHTNTLPKTGELQEFHILFYGITMIVICLALMAVIDHYIKKTR